MSVKVVVGILVVCLIGFSNAYECTWIGSTPFCNPRCDDDCPNGLVCNGEQKSGGCWTGKKKNCCEKPTRSPTKRPTTSTTPEIISFLKGIEDNNELVYMRFNGGTVRYVSTTSTSSGISVATSIGSKQLFQVSVDETAKTAKFYFDAAGTQKYLCRSTALYTNNNYKMKYETYSARCIFEMSGTPDNAALFCDNQEWAKKTYYAGDHWMWAAGDSEVYWSIIKTTTGANAYHGQSEIKSNSNSFIAMLAVVGMLTLFALCVCGYCFWHKKQSDKVVVDMKHLHVDSNEMMPTMTNASSKDMVNVTGSAEESDVIEL